jgi:hypothetical protein
MFLMSRQTATSYFPQRGGVTMVQSTIHPGHATAAHRILSGRAPELAGTDEDRAARVAAAHLPWLAHLDDEERQVCLDEVVRALVSGTELGTLIETWADSAAQRLAARIAGFRR